MVAPPEKPWREDGAHGVAIADSHRSEIKGGIEMETLLDEIHPGEILLEEFMKPLGITARQLAADIEVLPSRISGLVHGSHPITADTALRLGLYFEMEPCFWLALQNEYDRRITTC